MGLSFLLFYLDLNLNLNDLGLDMSRYQFFSWK